MVALEKYLTEELVTQFDPFNAVVFSEQEPNWVGRFVERLSKLRSLPSHWDGAGAAAIQPHVATYVQELVLGLSYPALKEPQVVPTVFGGLQVEWHGNEVSIEIEVNRPMEANILIEFIGDGGFIERELLPDDNELLAALDLVSA